jgi:hypothetical protein
MYAMGCMEKKMNFSNYASTYLISVIINDTISAAFNGMDS